MDRITRDSELNTAGRVPILRSKAGIGEIPRLQSPRPPAKLRDTVLISGLIGALVCFLPPATCVRADDQITTAAEKGHPLTANELDTIYGDRTWPWKDGAAYFGTRDRTFKAWVGGGDKTSYADGSWSVNDQGRLCFHATWHGLGRHKSTTTTCMEHRTDDQNIYQRKLPEGQWYVFSHLPAQPGDEIQKFQRGDHISDGYRKAEGYVDEHGKTAPQRRRRR